MYALNGEECAHESARELRKVDGLFREVGTLMKFSNGNYL